MQKKRMTEIYKAISDHLTQRYFLKKIKFTKKSVLSILKDEKWTQAVKNTMEASHFSCRNVLENFLPCLEGLCSESPSVGWFSYSYLYLRKGLFPESIVLEEKSCYNAVVLFYLEILRVFIEQDRHNRAFDPMKDFIFLTQDELMKSHHSEEYLRFKECYQKNYIYEMMCIGKEETDFNALGHIAGVHAIAMHVARQMEQAGVAIDLSLVSGASAGHDIGKYGCKNAEVKRMPYLHYYYTDQWFKNYDMPAIGHIASNHSTWDLELENLSVESLVLIYADFRVKSSGKKDGKEQIAFYTLSDSFNVILNKLDNLNNAKKDRYIHVYAKLVDFQSYMHSLGVNTELGDGAVLKSEVQKDAVLMDLGETVQNLKYMAIDHNIRLMNKLGSESSFASIVESARSEKNWKNSRAYLNIFEEYFTYMTQKQKMITLHFLYELLMHREGDIRRQAADLMGNIIVHFDEEYRKELPEDVAYDINEYTAFQLWEFYLEKIILPDHKVTEQHKRWIGYALKLVVESVLMRCRKGEEIEYLTRFLKYYENWEREDSTAFILVDCMLLLPVFILSEAERSQLLQFVQELAKRDSEELHVGILRFLKYVTETVQKTPKDAERIVSILKIFQKENAITVQFLVEKIIKNWRLDASVCPYNETLIYKDAEVVSDIFLENLKAATPWIKKSVNLELLLDRISVDHSTSVLHVATHLSNLIKVSERVTVRHSAGEALLKIAPLLSRDQRNEVAIELTKGLEIGEYQFSKYIPQYLGEFALYLHPKELDEFIRDLKSLLISTNERVVCVTLDTIGIVLQKYNSYRTRFSEEKGVFEERKKQFLGMLLSGLANYRNSVSQEAFLVIGQYLFGNEALSLKEKKNMFQVLYKKLTTLIGGKENTELAFFNNAASLNHIYRFINDYLFYYNEFDIREPYKVAFFPGSFDPFSLGHKGIAKEIRDMGFMVYLALDEFSWSKKTQPRMIRRQIMSMSVANEENIYLFPDNIPVNISNPKDLLRLKKLFRGKEIYMVAGSDVVENASSYKLKPVKNSIQTFHHILFLRSSQVEEEEKETISPEQRILGNLIQLKLPMHLEDISSTRIRENIDLNRDISNLIDPVAQNYIYENSLYLREPQYKEVIHMKSIRASVREGIDEALFMELQDLMPQEAGKFDFLNALKKEGQRVLLLQNEASDKKLLGAVVFCQIGTSELYGEFKSTNVANFIRENTSGKIVLISSIYENKEYFTKELVQILLTETLAYALERDFTYAVFSPRQGTSVSKYKDLLERQGFFELRENDTDRMVYAVDMKMPLTLFKNVETVIKEPFRHNLRVLEAIDRSHERLQSVLTTLFPGNLVLSFHADFMHNKIVDLITEANEVPNEPLPVRKLGKRMCVPFGKILKGKIVPNTITKSLHTEKTFDSQIKKFNITEYPNYSPLISQIRTIKSFNRPVILVDDILHKGYRIRKLDPIFKQENVEIDRLIVGILSGRGKDLMEIQNRQVESAYFLPSMHSWFVESSIYPFLGGDLVERTEKMQANLLNSVNLILPYVAPGFLMDASKASIYDFSMTCLENAREIMQVLEEEYQIEFERKLTLNRLSEVIMSPCCPDKGGCLNYDYHLRASVYIANDIEKLIRLKNFIE
ncbi:hypothetical protein [Sinanaerobacter sp. ZZT-01]|uniref:nicotinate-nicotinamide nucleotide adenylyltransferase n=1 Tax=Sinanaerobacter sp. ZZT-01 TaxID=3111540 RepID=UPI002D7724E3|nr:hypothetical protein [Sinanaerobacter sp. ZZT-01]WRR92244.1 hypothetical protein U5921_09205 [Sinanaerobacter sp. ZZT-01]